METSDAVAALAALAQDSRLEIFRLLVQAGPDGLAAGRVAEALNLAPNMLTFHFDSLPVAGVGDHERLARLSHRELLPSFVGIVRGGSVRAGGMQAGQANTQEGARFM